MSHLLSHVVKAPASSDYACPNCSTLLTAQWVAYADEDDAAPTSSAVTRCPWCDKLFLVQVTTTVAYTPDPNTIT